MFEFCFKQSEPAGFRVMATSVDPYFDGKDIRSRAQAGHQAHRFYMVKIVQVQIDACHNASLIEQICAGLYFVAAAAHQLQGAELSEIGPERAAG
jgi:glutamate formiminotransferase